ncbi:Gfo/Idh/MocA family protein [Cohnella yongneupensis]|uniref:Gfo/Idh/MocA family protein n=1 Tax=Cohnella yongneupensis TaxID=425006 RepID=A0ABW0R115_9BACL
MIRFGIIGTNWITERFIEAARESDRFALTAVYSRTEAKAREFADKHGAAHAYADLDAFAASREFDAVYIATPNFLHAEHAIVCMNEGKHVLCEKPVASNVPELERMLEAAKRNSVTFMEALLTTHLPNFRAIEDNLHKLGKIRRYFASYCQYSSRYDAYKEGNVMNAFKPELSNGALMDLGIYCIYALVTLFGEPQRVQADAYMLESGVDGQGNLQLNYGDMNASILYSKISTSYAPAEIQGENATMVIDKINTPEHVEIRYRDGTIETLTRPQPNKFMYYETEHFIDLVASGQPESPTNSWRNSLNALRIMDESRKQIGLVYPADRISE